MALNPRFWYPIAAFGTFVNVVAFAFAVRPGEPWHAAIHAGLAVAFGAWAQHLRAARQSNAAGSGREAEIAELQDAVGDVRRELSELQERMDFAERILSQHRERERLPDRPPHE